MNNEQKTMNNEQRTKRCFTLVEMLIAVAIIAILVSMVIGVAGHIDNRAKEQLAESTIAILTAALGQFRDYGYNYDNSVVDYSDFKFPLDCSGFTQDELKGTLSAALGAGDVEIYGAHERNYSGSEVLYFFLSRVPASRKTLDKIDRLLITNKGSNRQGMSINIGGKDYSLLRIIDPWGKTLWYSYYEDIGHPEDRSTFPVITSAGPDGNFGTVGDNITSR